MTSIYQNNDAMASATSVASSISGVSNKESESLISHGSRDNKVPHSSSLFSKINLRFSFLRQKDGDSTNSSVHHHGVRHVRIPAEPSVTTTPASQATQYSAPSESTRLLGQRPMTAADAVRRAIDRHDGDLLLHEGRMKQAAAFIRDLSEIAHPDDWAAVNSAKDKHALRNDSLLDAPRLLTDFVKSIGEIENRHSSESPGEAREDMQLNALAAAHKAFEFLDRHAYVTGDTMKKFRQSGLPNAVNVFSRRGTPVFDSTSRAAFADAVATLCVQNMNNTDWKTPHAQNYFSEVEFACGLRSTNPSPAAIIGLVAAPFKSVISVHPATKRQDKTLNHAVNLLAKAIKSYDKTNENLDRELIDKCTTLLKTMPAESSMRKKLYKVLVSRIDQAEKSAIDRELAANTAEASRQP